MADIDQERRAAKGLRHQCADNCRNDDRGQRGDGVNADDQFECIKCAGEGGIERAGNSRRRTATDQRAQIGPTQLERAPDA